MSSFVIKSKPDLSKARDRVTSPKLIFEDRKIPSLVKEFARGRKFFIKTYGCQANVRDEEVMAGYLTEAGFTRTEDPKESDLAIINTCAVRENAEDKVYGEIGLFKANKTANKDFVLCLCGCMMQQEGVAEKLKASYPHISIVFGTHNVHMLLPLLEEHLKTKKDILDVKSSAGDVVENLPSERLDEFKAFVNISYGCDKFCTYCIVPYTRGRERSRPEEEILKECQCLIDQGYKEITLLGQNVNSYGKDLPNGEGFARLLDKVAALGVPRLRFMTSHPWDFSEDMIDVMAKHDNIMKFIHLPVQSGSDSVLRRMGRRYTRQQYLDLVALIRSRIPDVALSTDIIVGFPNESEEEFEDTLTIAQTVGYDAAFTFIYSPRKGTPAAAIKDDVSDKDKHERFNRLLKVIESSVVKHSEQMVGKVYDVLVDGPSKKDETVLSGYTESSKLINFKGPAYLRGHIVKAKVTENHAFSMIGELCDDPLLMLANELSDAIKEEQPMKEFLLISRQISEDESIKALRKTLMDAQRKMASSKDDDEGFKVAKTQFDETKRLLDNHPLILNQKALYDEVNRLLTGISEVLK